MHRSPETARLREEIAELAPWHIEVEVAPGLSTRTSLDAPAPTEGPKDVGRVAFVDARDWWHRLVRTIYPEGLQGRSMLDCACNCGAYLFWSRELGAGDCFGFDARKHWIDQARFLARARRDGEIRFEERDLYGLPELGLAPFDLVLFKGILYHLPEPVAGLKIAADLAGEVLIVDTAFRSDLPDYGLAIGRESPIPVMSGIHGLNWFPTGPRVIARMLGWMGFPIVRLIHRRSHSPDNPSIGRVGLIAARTGGLIENFEPLDRAGDFSVIGRHSVIRPRASRPGEVSPPG